MTTLSLRHRVINGPWLSGAVETSLFQTRTVDAPHAAIRLVLIIASPPKQTFQLESLSFACVSGVPQPECAISIWGWKASAKVINRVINFPSLDPGHLVGGYIMNKTSFSWEWRDLKSVGFSIARADNGGDMYGGLALDDVKYTLNFGC